MPRAKAPSTARPAKPKAQASKPKAQASKPKAQASKPKAQASKSKAQALKAIRAMKNTASFEDIMREIYTLQKLERGLDDEKAGRTMPHAGVKQLLGRWLK